MRRFLLLFALLPITIGCQQSSVPTVDLKRVGDLFEESLDAAIPEDIAIAAAGDAASEEPAGSETQPGTNMPHPDDDSTTTGGPGVPVTSGPEGVVAGEPADKPEGNGAEGGQGGEQRTGEEPIPSVNPDESPDTPKPPAAPEKGTDEPVKEGEATAEEQAFLVRPVSGLTAFLGADEPEAAEEEPEPVPAGEEPASEEPAEKEPAEEKPADEPAEKEPAAEEKTETPESAPAESEPKPAAATETEPEPAESGTELLTDSPEATPAETEAPAPELPGYVLLGDESALALKQSLAVLDQFEERLNQAKMHSDSIGIQFMANGEIEGYVDSDGNGRKLGIDDVQLFVIRPVEDGLLIVGADGKERKLEDVPEDHVLVQLMRQRAQAYTEKGLLVD